MTHGGGPAPERLSQAVTELIALRGWAQLQGQARLNEAWRSAAGESFAAATKVLGVRRGIMQVAVGSSPLLSELAAFHKPALLESLSKAFPELKIRDLKFVMRSLPN
jgi:predicted nucleic acid-binding Zn ribbon protein